MVKDELIDLIASTKGLVGLWIDKLKVMRCSELIELLIIFDIDINSNINKKDLPC